MMYLLLPSNLKTRRQAVKGLNTRTVDWREGENVQENCCDSLRFTLLRKQIPPPSPPSLDRFLATRDEHQTVIHGVTGLFPSTLGYLKCRHHYK
ncbi:hypothetical protein AOLI_G00031190 [Acnodon oligacanthus]